ncbi:MAG: hypothetical protein GKR95_08870 [Gammaproteobacteria bacterium]|nr:hypothetical protein [Gammaproteobacteria bacterium]
MHTASRIVLIFLFLLSLIWAYASGDILSAWKQIRGNTTSQWETRYITYSEDSEFEPENHFLESSLEVNSSAILSDRWFLESTPELRWDRANKVGSGSHYNERGLDRSGITLKHWTINYSGEASELSVGKQTFSWGKGELFSPADDLSPIDQLDLASSEKLGVTAFTTRYFADKFSTEFVLLPTFTPNRMPPNNNRWTRARRRWNRQQRANQVLLRRLISGNVFFQTEPLKMPNTDFDSPAVSGEAAGTLNYLF